MPVVRGVSCCEARSGSTMKPILDAQIETPEERAFYEVGFADGIVAGRREAEIEYEARIGVLEDELRRARFDLRFRP